MTGELRALTNLARAASAGAGDVQSLVGRMCASLAESFGFDDVAAYRLLPDTEELLQLGDVAALVPLGERTLFIRALDTGEPRFEGGAFALPLPAAEGVVGFVAGACESPCDDSQLEVLAACGAFVAVSLQRAFEHEELERLGRLKSNFIALASHELRSPATIVHGIAKTIDARATALGEDQVAVLQHTLVEQTERLTRLIDELLDLSRLEAKAIEIQPEPLQVRARVEEIVSAVAGDARDAVEVSVDPDLRASLDPKALDRILSNLVTNALRHGQPPIQVRAQQQDRHFRLTVEDAGEGVAAGFVPRLFERFSRAEGGMQRAGAGLGLSIAQSYAQAHGGQLFYEDATPQGARFQLVLPAPHD